MVQSRSVNGPGSARTKGVRRARLESVPTPRPRSDIAAELHLSEGTVRNYLSEAISKLGARNRVEAARVARAKGWL